MLFAIWGIRQRCLLSPLQLNILLEALASGISGIRGLGERRQGKKNQNHTQKTNPQTKKVNKTFSIYIVIYVYNPRKSTKSY